MNSERVFTIKFTPGVTPGHNSETWHVVASDALRAIDAVKKYVEPVCKQLGVPLHVESAEPTRLALNCTPLWVHLPCDMAATPTGEADIPHEVNAEGEKVVTSSNLLKMFPNGVAAPAPSSETAPAGPGLVSGGARPDNVEPPKP